MHLVSVLWGGGWRVFLMLLPGVGMGKEAGVDSGSFPGKVSPGQMRMRRSRE